jgi:hypothetical protein
LPLSVFCGSLHNPLRRPVVNPRRLGRRTQPVETVVAVLSGGSDPIAKQPSRRTADNNNQQPVNQPSRTVTSTIPLSPNSSRARW